MVSVSLSLSLSQTNAYINPSTAAHQSQTKKIIQAKQQELKLAEIALNPNDSLNINKSVLLGFVA